MKLKIIIVLMICISFIVIFALYTSNSESSAIMKEYNATHTLIRNTRLEVSLNSVISNINESYVGYDSYDEEDNIPEKTDISVPDEDKLGDTSPINGSETGLVNMTKYPIIFKTEWNGKTINAYNFFSYNDSNYTFTTDKAKKDASTLFTTIEIKILNFKGEKSTKKMVVNSQVSQSVVAIFNELVDIGFKINQVGCQDFRENRRNAGGTKYAHVSHPNGLAIDINWDLNGFVTKDGSYHNNWKVKSKNKEDGYITEEVVNIFKKHGWYWGGDWKKSVDLMHFSITNH